MEAESEYCHLLTVAARKRESIHASFCGSFHALMKGRYMRIENPPAVPVDFHIRSRTVPSLETVMTCHGMSLPLLRSADSAAR